MTTLAFLSYRDGHGAWPLAHILSGRDEGGHDQTHLLIAKRRRRSWAFVHHATTRGMRVTMATLIHVAREQARGHGHCSTLLLEVG